MIKNPLKLPKTGRPLAVPVLIALFTAAGTHSRAVDTSAMPDTLERGEIGEAAPAPSPSPRAGAASPDEAAGRGGVKKVRYPNAYTLSPLHAALLFSVEGSYERMVSHHVGVVGTLGAGTLTSLFGALRGPGLDLQEAGVQVRWYPREQARWNPHLGVEGFWGRADWRQDLSGDDGWLALDFSGVWTAWGAGPFVGTKFIGYGGVVVEVQAGAQVLRISNEWGDLDHQLWPIVNINVGKGF